MVTKRQFTALITLPLLTAVSIGEVTITPLQYFASPIYWAGFVTFALFGAFLYGNMKSVRIQRYGAMGFGVVMVAIAFVSKAIPEILNFGFGFLGLFVGLLLRVLAWIGLQTRWAYCPTCQRKEWAHRKSGAWVCEKGHSLNFSR